MTRKRKARPKAKAQPSAQRKRGTRPSPDDPVLREQVLAAVAMGVPVRTACLLAGIGESTFYQWQTRGNRDLEAGRATKWRRFAEDVTRARAEAEASHVTQLMKLAKKDARTLLAILARMYPETWGRPGHRMTAEQEAAAHAAKVRQAEAEARLTEARAAALETATQGGGGMVLVPSDLLQAMPESLRMAFQMFLGEQGLAVLSPPSFGEVSEAEIRSASPSPLPALDGPKDESP